MQRRQATILFVLFLSIAVGCSHTSPSKKSHESHVTSEPLGAGSAENKPVYIPPSLNQGQGKDSSEPNSLTQLDEKSRSKVDEAFKAIILNDDKKAKLAYGRSYKFMPEFIQFAFDLRFRNLEHALELLPKLPYEAAEKEFWQKILKQKPASFSKSICDHFKAAKFQMASMETAPEELAWSQEYYGVMNDLLKKEQAKLKPAGITPLNQILGKIRFKDKDLKPLALDTETQKIIYNDDFFDKLRNAQRRDTRYWLDNHKNVLKAWVYHRAFMPLYVYDLYASMLVTDHPKKNHYLRRLKGIIKDMRVESLLARARGNAAIEDRDDLPKQVVVSQFMNRHPFITVLLYFEPQLSSCGLN